MNVLSLFDGMSCGQIALKQLEIPVNKYYASEIDKFSIKQTQHNFPKTIQLGDVQTIKAKDLDKIDLLIGGSPCQGFSLAGKQLNFDDERSKLFFEFVRIWEEVKTINPDAKFLLENVNMKRKYLGVISKYMGVYPVRINSSLVSAQNRDRFYWTNLNVEKRGLFGELYSNISQPRDKGIFLKDILQPESEVLEKYYVKDISQSFNEKVVLNYINDSGIVKLNKKMNPKKNQDKASCFTAGANSGGNHSDMDLIFVGGIGKIISEGDGTKSRDYSQGYRIYNPQGKSCTISAEGGGIGGKTGLYLIIPEATKKGFIELYSGDCADLENISSKTRRGRKMEDKSNCLMHSGNHFYKYTYDYRIRRLTPLECCRLQTIPEWYKWIVSDFQCYKMLGNGWTIDVISHILSYL